MIRCLLRTLWLSLFLCTCAGPAMAAPAASADAAALVPVPARLETLPGRYLPGADLQVALRGDAARLRDLGGLAVEMLGTAWGRPARLADARRGADLVLALSGDAGDDGEAYALRVDAAGIRIEAAGEPGLFYGLQTLRQLLEQSDAAQGLGFIAIEDAPRFSWRGLHLDVGRHLFPVEYIKRQLELMARYKFNVLHWHLTEDQGWRLEIRRYPELTEAGAWRKRTAHHHRDGRITYDERRYGGYYTQAQAREIVAYARKLHIEVVPEIEMPGHAVAALAAYPELGCTRGPFEVWTDWGVNDEVFCPSERTFEFLEGVLDEVMAIFPSRYIHVGGDEAPTLRWERSALAQSIIRREGLADEHALQGWFMRRIEAYLHRHGRRMLAWDEMLAGNPAPSTTIMAWRSLDEGARAARRGHDVVMTPTAHSYFDYCQSRSPDEPYCPGHLPLRQVYAFEPVPAALAGAQARHVLGGQANLWTEHIRTPAHAEYMLWPRALAMAEVLWSPAAARDWNAFGQRLGPQLAALGKLGVNYRVPEVLGLDGDVLTLTPGATVALRSPLPDARIVYTLDGTAPRADSPRYGGPLRLALTDGPVTVSARLLTADGRLGPVMRARYARTTLRPPRKATSGRPGLRRDYFELAARATDDLLRATPARTDATGGIGIPDFARAEAFGLRYRGMLVVPADGVYRFSLASDDGARLLVDDELLIDRDGPQSPGLTHGSVGLARGAHAFELRYFQGGGDRLLRLEVGRDGGPAGPVPAAWFAQP